MYKDKKNNNNNTDIEYAVQTESFCRKIVFKSLKNIGNTKL